MVEWVWKWKWVWVVLTITSSTRASLVDGTPFQRRWSRNLQAEPARSYTWSFTLKHSAAASANFDKKMKKDRGRRAEGGWCGADPICHAGLQSKLLHNRRCVFLRGGGKKTHTRTRGFSKCRDPCRPHAPLQTIAVGGAGLGWWGEGRVAPAALAV